VTQRGLLKRGMCSLAGLKKKKRSSGLITWRASVGRELRTRLDRTSAKRPKGDQPKVPRQQIHEREMVFKLDSRCSIKSRKGPRVILTRDYENSAPGQGRTAEGVRCSLEEISRHEQPVVAIEYHAESENIEKVGKAGAAIGDQQEEENIRPDVTCLKGTAFSEKERGRAGQAPG